jgi:DNA gyrase/topoisomerase IV subunit A
LQFKDGDALKLAFHANTTDKLVIVTTGGKAYTLGADKLPGGRGHGEPLRIMVDMDNDQAVLTAFVHRSGAQAADGLRPPATASSSRKRRWSPTPARASRS